MLPRKKAPSRARASGRRGYGRDGKNCEALGHLAAQQNAGRDLPVPGRPTGTVPGTDRLLPVPTVRAHGAPTDKFFTYCTGVAVMRERERGSYAGSFRIQRFIVQIGAQFGQRAQRYLVYVNRNFQRRLGTIKHGRLPSYAMCVRGCIKTACSNVHTYSCHVVVHV